MEKKNGKGALSPAEKFYHDVLKIAVESKIPFLIGGTYAVRIYTGIVRETKDIDLFCRPGDHTRLLELFQQRGYKTPIIDEQWLAKIKKDSFLGDVIFGLAKSNTPINDQWFVEHKEGELFGLTVPVMSPTELIWSKTIVQDRYKNDMSDIVHVILKQHKAIDWKRLLSHMEHYWELLLIDILYFRFVYPSEREKIPRWVLDELLERHARQTKLPTPKKKVCRGRLFSTFDYEIDVKEWGFEDLTS